MSSTAEEPRGSDAPAPDSAEVSPGDDVTLSRRVAAEFLGTAVLVIGGVGTAVFAGRAVGDLGIALAFGLTLLAMAYAIGPLSGCHINPAVTVGLLVAGKIRAYHAVGYIGAQMLGAVVGAALLWAIAVTRPGFDLAVDGLGANGYGAASPSGYSLGGVVITEIVLTFVLVFIVLATTDRIANAANAGLPIGLVLTVIHLVSIPVDGTSVNPARSFGPALFARGAAPGQLWVFLLIPLIGAVVAALIYRGLFQGASRIPDILSAVTPSK